MLKFSNWTKLDYIENIREEPTHFLEKKLTESERDSTVILAPALDVFVGIGPEEIAEETGVRNVGRAHDAADLLHGLEWGKKKRKK